MKRWSEVGGLGGGREQLEKPGNEVDILGYSNTIYIYSICTLGVWKNWMDSV